MAAKDQVTEMAKAGLALQERFGQQIKEVTGAPELDADDLVDLYLRANFEQRYQMFAEILGSRGADGLKLLSEVYEKATARLAGEE